jgi:outer membrane protein OmpA-like peptidoglycan-associated protein
MTMSSRNHLTMLAFPWGAAAALALGACASTPAPVELVEARRAYNHAHDGPTSGLVPASVLSAQQALARAEEAFTDAPDAQRTRDLAYVARRRAEIADALGAIAADRRDKAQAEEDLRRAQVDTQARTQAELTATRQALASQQQVLAVQGQQLTAEQRARRAAEREAHAALASLERIAAVKEEARGVVITLNGSVLFATGQSILLPIAEDRLDQVARALADDPGAAIVVEGHTDSTGLAAANEDLSRRRAEAVRDYLIAHGVDRERIRAVGLASSRPIADNRTPEGRANNRRVEIVVGHDSGAR